MKCLDRMLFFGMLVLMVASEVKMLCRCWRMNVGPKDLVPVYGALHQEPSTRPGLQDDGPGP